MRIDYLAAAPDRAGRFTLRFADGSSLRLYRQTVEGFGLYTGLELTQEELKKLRRAAGEMSAKMRAVRIVSASSVSRADLEQRLVRKGEDAADAKQAVAWMEGLNLLDDRATAEQVVRSCVCKGYGLSRAKQALYEKRIPRELWEEALADYPDQSEKIESFLRTRLGPESDRREIKRAVDALIRRGHSYGSIQRVLRTMQLETEEYLED